MKALAHTDTAMNGLEDDWIIGLMDSHGADGRQSFYARIPKSIYPLPSRSSFKA